MGININEKDDRIQETLDIPADRSCSGNYSNPDVRLITGYQGTESAFQDVVSHAFVERSFYRIFLCDSCL